MKRTKIKLLLKREKPCSRDVLIKGWIRTKRASKEFCFLEVNDGSCLANIQVIAQKNLINYDEIEKITNASSVSVIGKLVKSLGKGQKFEIISNKIEIFNLAPDSYPLQKKRHSDEFLRRIAHLRPRTNKYSAIFRIRSEMIYAIHKFYKEQGFICLNTPIITGSDCEGAGQLFKVTNLDYKAIKEKKTKDFFGQDANLTVSGQLSAEMFALALGDVYTLGPTFRAENSNTSRHAAEFWMLEPEMAFCDLEQNMDHAEELVKYLISYAMSECYQDMELFMKFVDKSLNKRIEKLLNLKFDRITYAQAIEILKKSKQNFEFKVSYGNDLHSEHERYLSEIYFKNAVFVKDYPAKIKPFYMRMNDDKQSVAALDLLVPGIGELIGGSQREERLDILETRMAQANLSKDKYWWYLDSRIYGSVVHSGFGMGFERFLMMLTGISNIRDVIPFPRTVGSIDF